MSVAAGVANLVSGPGLLAAWKNSRRRPLAGLLIPAGLSARGLQSDLSSAFDIAFNVPSPVHAVDLAALNAIDLLVAHLDLLGSDFNCLRSLEEGWEERKILGVIPDGGHSRMARGARFGIRYFVLEGEEDPARLIETALRAAAGMPVENPVEGRHLNGFGKPKRHDLTRRELEILELLACGYEDQMIGLVIHMSTHGVKKRVRSILEKLGARNRTEAAVLGLLTGICDRVSIHEKISQLAIDPT